MRPAHARSIDLDECPIWTAGAHFPPEARLKFQSQLDTFGFLAVSVPTTQQASTDLYSFLEEMLTQSNGEVMDTYDHRYVPQTSTSNHGYFGFGTEVPTLSGVPDPKEFVHVSGAMIRDDPIGSRDLLTAFPSFGRQATALFDLGINLASAILEVLFGAEPLTTLGTQVGDLVNYESSVLRTIRYQLSGTAEVLAGTHTGIQTVGVQFPPSSSGLEYLDRNSDWVEPLLVGRDIIVCNIGRALTLSTNGLLRPSPHRVRAMPGGPGKRFSTVLFVHPNHATKAWRLGDTGLQDGDATWADLLFDPKSALRQSYPLI